MPAYPLPIHYNRAERRGMVPLCCRTIECFRPTQFAAVGYPTTIHSLSELWKYTECMHDGFGLGEPMDHYLVKTLLMGGFTEEELEQARTIKAAVDDLAKSINHPCEYPTNSMFLAMNQARHISALAPPGATIVELGGGAGYLGALLVLRGYRYVATDVAQALYLLQSHLISRVAPRGCIDLLDERYGEKELRTLQPGQAAMIPWWRWVQRPIPGALSIDLLTSNHNLLEMHPFSRLYHLTVAQERFSASAVGLVFEGWGDPSRNAPWTAVKDLADRGFVLAYNDRRMTCFAPQGQCAPETILRYPLPLPVSGPSPSAPATSIPAPTAAASRGTQTMVERAARRLANDMLSELVAEVGAALSARLDAISLRVDAMSVAPASNPNEFHFATPEFAGRGNPMSSRILAMREKEQAGLTSTLDDYRALLGSADLTTQDERFLAYIFRDTALARPWVTSLPN